MSGELRTAARALARSPLYTTVAILTLALGIGATTAVFTVVSSVLLKPLPFADPDRLVVVQSARGHGRPELPSYPDFDDLHANQDAFAGLAFIAGDGVTLRRPQGGTGVLEAMVTDDYFALLGARPVIGRLLAAADHRPGAPPVAVLSHALWVGEYAADRSVIGRSLDLSNGTFTVVGVLGPGQNYPEWVPGTHTDLYVPLNAVPSMLHGILTKRDSHSDSRTIARLAPGLTAAQAEQRLRTVAARLAAAYPASDAGLAFTVRPVRDWMLGDIRPAFAVLAGAVTFVLLLACADTANLALVRAVGREREIAVCSALGAGRAHIVRVLLSESAILASAGGVLGVVIALVGVRVFVDVAPADLPRLDEIGVDWRSLAVAVVATVAATLLSALAPVLVTRRRDLVPALKAGGRGSGIGRRGLRLRGAIVTAQVALSVVLITGAGLLIKSFALLRHVDPGYDPSHLITWSYTVPERQDAVASRRAFHERVEATFRVPGVESVALVNHPPLEPGGAFTPVGPDNRDPAADSVGAIYEIVSPGYFSTMRIPVVAGREFTDADLAAGAVPSIVSAYTAKRYWPNVDPIGRSMTVINSVHYRNPDFGTTIHTTVVGVVGNVKKFTLDEDPFPVVYLPMSHPVAAGMKAVARTTVPPGTLLPTLRRALSALDPDAIVSELPVETTRIAGTLAPQRFMMSLLGIVAGVALALAALGLYGVVAYAVSQRHGEFGIRLALGAHTVDILRIVARGATALVGVGLVLGVAGALALGGTLRSLLYGVAPNDPATLLIVVGVLAGVAALASYLPARRAARIDPVVALRSE